MLQPRNFKLHRAIKKSHARSLLETSKAVRHWNTNYGAKIQEPSDETFKLTITKEAKLLEKTREVFDEGDPPQKVSMQYFLKKEIGGVVHLSYQSMLL